jgi:hypothetical protein
MPGIDTSNVGKPGAISLPAVNRDLIIAQQLNSPHFYNKYVQQFGAQDYTEFLKQFGGMEKVEGQQFFHFESKGKKMQSVDVTTAIVAPAAGATVTYTLGAADHYDSGSKSALRAGETVKIASSGIEGKVLSVNKSVANAHTAQIRPLKSTQAFVSAGSANLLVGDVLKLMSNTEAGEASTNIASQIGLDDIITNNVTQVRDDFTVTDLAKKEQVFYEYVEDGGFMSAGIKRGKQGAYTYKGMVETAQRFANNVAFKLMFGGEQTNTGLNAGTVGTKGLVPEIQARGNSVTYSLGALGLARLHAITAQMDVMGNPLTNQWLMDIQQRQEIDDTLFAQYPAGAFVWGSNSASEQASVAYGFDNFKIDNYQLQLKKYAGFNTEAVYGKTPLVDQYRNFGIIMPQGEVYTKFGNGGSQGVINTGRIKNVQLMYQEPQGGGTISNGIKVWEYGGDADVNQTATLDHTVSMVTYQAIRLAGAKQFFTVSGS